jgi:hypothetical protein
MSTAPATARALFERERHGVLCTAHAALDGWPFGSVVPFATLPDGGAVVLLADIAEHTKNLERDPRACLFVADAAAGARPQAGARLAVLVRAQRLAGAEAARAEDVYVARFPDAARTCARTAARPRATSPRSAAFACSPATTACMAASPGSPTVRPLARSCSRTSGQGPCRATRTTS